MVKFRGFDSALAQYFMDKLAELMIRMAEGKHVDEKELARTIQFLEELDYFSEIEDGLVFDPNGNMSTLGVQDGKRVSTDVFQMLMDGRNPATGEYLNPHRRQDSYRAGTDYEFSAPKDFSVLWASSDAKQRKILDEILIAAVRDGLGLLHDRCERSVGKGRENHEKANFTAIQHMHRTNRNQDPHIHVHNLILSPTLSAAGWRNIDHERLTHWATAADAAINASLIMRLKEAFPNLRVSPTEHAFQIDDFPRELVDEFSSRSRDMKAELQKMIQDGSVDPNNPKQVLSAMNYVWGTTRKGKEIRDEKLIEQAWDERAVEATNGTFDKLTLRALMNAGAKVASKVSLAAGQFEQEFGKITRGLLETESAAKEQEVWRETFQKFFGRADTKTISAAIKSAFQAFRDKKSADLKKDDEHAIRILRNLDGKDRLDDLTRNRLISTAGQERAEMQLFKTSKALSSQFKHQVPADILERILAKWKAKGLTEEQEFAVRHAVNTGDIAVVEGIAGSGKTFTMQVFKEVMEASGYKIFGVAGAWRQSNELQKGSGIDSMAIAQFMTDLNKGKIHIGPETILLIDEAGLVGSRTMAEVLEVCQKAGVKVVLTGEEAQLNPVEAGAAMRIVCQAVGETYLMEDIRRQKDPVNQQIVRDVRDGKSLNALAALDQRGDLIIAGKSQLMEKIIQDAEAWTSANPGKDWIMIAVKNQDRQDLSNMWRSVMRKRGALSGTDFTITTEFPRAGSKTGEKIPMDLNFAVGDKIAFTAHLKDKDILNQDTGLIKSITPSRDRPGTLDITVTRFREGRQPIEITFNTADWKDKLRQRPACIRHAYASTTFSSQGMSRDGVFTLMDSADRRSAYINISRCKEHIRVYADIAPLKARAHAAARDGRPIGRSDMLEQLARQIYRQSQKLTTIDPILEQISCHRKTVKEAVLEATARKKIIREQGKGSSGLLDTIRANVAQIAQRLQQLRQRNNELTR